MTVLKDGREISHIDKSGRVSYPLEEGGGTDRDRGVFLLSLRGTLRYKRKSSILLTAFLFFCFAITFLFFDRTEVQAFSWVGITLFAIVIAIWTAAAVYTFREPRAAEPVPAPSEVLETTEQG